MIGLDTNVLVRFLVEDDHEQSARASQVFARARRAGEPIYLSDVVLCELVWVLESAYRVPRPEIVAHLRLLLAARTLTFDDHALLVRALDAFETAKGDFADYVIRGRAESAGCARLLTFERALQREPGFAAP